MKHIKSPAPLFCAFLLLVTLAGCLKTDTYTDLNSELGNNVPELTDPIENETDNDISAEDEIIAEDVINADDDINADDEHVHGIDFEAAMAAFPPDTIMLRADDILLTWEDLYVFLFRYIDDLILYPGMYIDWTKEDGEGRTLSDKTLDYAVEEALSYVTIEYGAKALNITPDDDKLINFQADLKRLHEIFDRNAEFEHLILNQRGFYSFDVFERLLTLDYLSDLVMEDLYGEYLFDFPEEKVAAYARRERYMFAKHILRLKTDDDTETPLADIEDILRQLRVYRSAYYFVDVFAGMMHEYSDDHDGLVLFPYGYLFKRDDMAAPFSDACAALRVGQLSGIIETDYGYHIILRLPFNFDTVPLALADSATPYTLRQLAVRENFETVLLGWRESMDPEYTPELTSLDIGSVFKMCQH